MSLLNPFNAKSTKMSFTVSMPNRRKCRLNCYGALFTYSF